MLFNSSAFAVFFAIFCAFYFPIHKNLRPRNLLVVAASYVFYGWWDPRFLTLVALSTSTDYCAALGASGQMVTLRDRLKSAALLAGVSLIVAAIARRDLLAPGLAALAALGFAAFHFLPALPFADARKRWLLFSLIVNFGLLFVFKYFNFFVDQGVALAQTLGFDAHPVALRIVLPVGLSFFTFQATGRTIDSYCGRYRPARNLLDYAAFHAFFPQLIAGPIERAAHLMPQFESVRSVRASNLADGSLLFVWGLLKKTVVADNAAPLADNVFASQSAGFTSAEAAVAALAFTFQIYGDFSGYSDMARGLARILGFDLMRNFNIPYCARSPAEFWRRWHISLSQWLRDFLYIPLGGGRGGAASTYRNLLATMTLGGLWHGASWTFAAWGAYHGALQVGYRALGLERRIAAGVLAGLLAWMATMTVVVVGWVLFRAADLDRAVAVVGRVLVWTGPALDLRPLCAIVAPLVGLEVVEWALDKPDVYLHAPGWVRGHFALFACLTILAFGATAGPQFLYFDF